MAQVRRLSFIPELVRPEETTPQMIPSHPDVRAGKPRAVHGMLKFRCCGLVMNDRIFSFQKQFTLLIMFELDLQCY